MDKMIGKRISQARKTKQLTQEDLSELSGLSVSAISRIETGSNSTSLKTLYRLCDILGVSLTYMLYDLLSEQQAPVQSPIVSDIVALTEQLDESQQQFILDFVKIYISHSGSDSL